MLYMIGYVYYCLVVGHIHKFSIQITRAYSIDVLRSKITKYSQQIRFTNDSTF
mgnify:CR=1 FL=1